MKKCLKFFLITILSLVGVSSFAGEKPIQPSELPTAAIEYIKANFPTTTISFATKDGGWFSTDYDVALSDSTMLEFDSAGEWAEIKNSLKGLSYDLLPQKIKATLEVRFVGSKVKSIEKKSNLIEVDLFDGRVLKFDKSGNLVSVDD